MPKKLSSPLTLNYNLDLRYKGPLLPLFFYKLSKRKTKVAFALYDSPSISISLYFFICTYKQYYGSIIKIYTLSFKSVFIVRKNPFVSKVNIIAKINLLMYIVHCTIYCIMIQMSYVTFLYFNRYLRVYKCFKQIYLLFITFLHIYMNVWCKGHFLDLLL